MNITKDLMDEHQLILGYIQLLKKYVEHSEGERSDAILEKGKQFIDFIQNFADRFHLVRIAMVQALKQEPEEKPVRIAAEEEVSGQRRAFSLSAGHVRNVKAKDRS